MAEQKALTPIQRLSNTVATVQAQIEDYCNKGRLDLPQNYSVGNALKQAQLMIQDNEKLMACTPASIAKALIDMSVLGLNVSKQQCYIINYGNNAQLSVSYMGRVAIAKRVNPNIKEVFARVVKKGEEFDFEDTLDGNTRILKHKRTIESLSSKDIVAAYATATYHDGSEPTSIVMDYASILKRWMQSPMHPVDANGNIKPGSTHDKFTEEMCKRTVINVLCKPIINQSSDADLFGATAQSVSLNEQATQSNAIADEKIGKGESIDVDFTELDDDILIDKETGEIK